MAAVCNRKIDEKETIELGTTGYTLNNVFVLYDRNSGTVWYPLEEGAFDAVSGADKGKKLKFASEPPKMKLSEWVAKHSDTEVLLPTARDLDMMRRRRERGNGRGE